MNIYKDYLDTIKLAMSADRKSGFPVTEDLSNFDGKIEKGFSYRDFINKVPETNLLPSLDDFSKEVGLQPDFNQRLGLHPDFAHLKQSDQTENHYIASVFIDIKGSTHLFRKYDPETVLIITNTIQRAAIHTCLIFKGYIHRLQGDGLFVYFGGKQINMATAVLHALQATSVFSYFVKHDLKNLFSEQGIDNIYTRIGIDLGFDDDVVWSKAGLGEISEVTTCSLHTSLASKMQSSAESNGIVVGDHVKAQINADFQDLFKPVCHRTRNENDRYIFRNIDDGFNYTQYDFDWLKFLKQQEFIFTDLDGNLGLKRKKQIVYSHQSIDRLIPIAKQSKPYSK
ncbi:putative adenylate cyclase [Fulvivirga imtechensis AK7]|uniref:Putative adenylate cyclase n=1 Tax=Fulvivirga imtechensis AK7 TaxID=1237149 RepID=L8JX05_9BACT|nr:adenylate/guanylate cyclase domain-containing protein [Fulvivirga imtechensis]ELR73305.1 putative adenylate cyclase [Fulvivirga imtechensis AK7]